MRSRSYLTLFCLGGLLLPAVSPTSRAEAEPLRVFFRGGPNSHGPGAHEHERFVADWTELLAERGAVSAGALDWPTAEQLAETDVVVAYAQEGGDATAEQKEALEAFVSRGGGLVVLHTATVSMQDPGWLKSMIGGAWVPGETQWLEGEMDLFYVENQQIGGGHPITRGASNFRMDDEIYYDMDLSPDIRVLATSYTPKVPDGARPAAGGAPHIFDIQPMMWTYERTPEGGEPYRAFVCIPGHLHENFSLPHFRAVLLRGIAWAGGRDDVDEFCTPEELEALTYPEGGPQRPEETLAHLEVHPDFELTLVASEPLINKPMNIDWDASGRMWVAETPEYPNGRRGMRPDYRGREWRDAGGIDPTPGIQDRPATDKISILSDTSGDGVMDHKHVFYEGLDLVTGLVFYGDGVIVTQAPDILWLRDTDGDGSADTVEKLYGNLGMGDTHAVINNPRWGWDGWIYATHGYSGSNQVVNASGERMPPIGSGVVRFRPDGSRIEQYSSKGGNTWGLQITAENRVMWTQPTSGTLLHHTVLSEAALARGAMPNRPGYEVVIRSPRSFPAMTWEQMAYVQIDLVGSFTAAAGTVLYDGGTWPEPYRGDYLTTEPTINVVHHQRLRPAGSSFRADKLPGREETEFIRSTDMWWRPIEVRVGPDGAVYVLDFYNQAVIHNDTRGPDHNRVNAAVRPDRDHYFGRIWRLDHKQAAPGEVPNLLGADPEELYEALSHPNRHIAMSAHRLLAESGLEADVVPAEAPQIVRGLPASGRIAALWTLAAIPGADPAMVLALMADEDADVRRNAAMVAAEMGGATASAAAALVEDDDAPVRIAALEALAVADLDAAAAAAIVAAWPRLDDDFQKSAALGAAAAAPARVISAALDAPDDALEPFVSRLAAMIGQDNDTEGAASLVISLAAKPAAADALKRGVLGTLGSSLRDLPPMTPELGEALATLLESGAAEAALPLAATWDREGALNESVHALIDRLAARLADDAASDAERAAAARGLLGARAVEGREVVPVVIGQLAEPGSADLKREIIAALVEVEGAEVGSGLALAYPQMPRELHDTLFDALLRRSDWSNALLDAIEAEEISPVAFGPGNAFRLRTHPDREIARRANEVLDAMNPQIAAKNELIASLAPVVSQPGDPANGKVLFSAACAICHVYGDEGGTDIGPNLTGMGSHGPGELLAAIVDPNREVEPSYITYDIETHDGRFFSGAISRENPALVVLKSMAGEQEIRTADIKSRVNTGRSLMPEGFEGLGAEGLRDIIAYMQSVDGGNYRTLDLRDAFTASTAFGLYQSREARGDTIRLARSGTVTLEEVPFNIIAADRAPTGNVIVLRGGGRGSFSATLPRQVEVAVDGFETGRLHFLGGVAGWGARTAHEGEPVLGITVTFADGGTETFTARNGVEFADYNARIEVPGSKPAYELVEGGGQLRWFSIDLSRQAPVESIQLRSLNHGIAPTLLAITAERKE